MVASNGVEVGEVTAVAVAVAVGVHVARASTWFVPLVGLRPPFRSSRRATAQFTAGTATAHGVAERERYW